MAKKKPSYEGMVKEQVERYASYKEEDKPISDKVYADLMTYNAMIDEWVEGLLSLKMKPEEIDIKTINLRKKKFYWIHWKRGTKGIKHYANMMLDHLEREQKERYQQMLAEKKEGENN